MTSYQLERFREQKVQGNGHFERKCEIVLGAQNCVLFQINKQESPAIDDKPVRRESLPKIAPIRRAYNVVADNTGLSSFV